MNDELTEPGRPGLRAKALGAATGAVVVVSGLAGFGILSATAQESGTTEAEPSAETTESTDEGINIFDIDGALDFAAFDACMADQLGDDWLSSTPLGIGGATGVEDLDDFASPENFDELPWDEIEDGSWESLEADFEAYEQAATACETSLPAEIQDEFAAATAFDACLTENGFDATAFDHHDSGPGVWIDGAEEQAVEFGEGAGSVTITSDGEALSVETSGDVTVLTAEDLDAEWEAMEAQMDAAFAACEDQLPDNPFGDFDFGDFDDFDFGDFEDFGDEDLEDLGEEADTDTEN